MKKLAPALVALCAVFVVSFAIATPPAHAQLLPSPTNVRFAWDGVAPQATLSWDPVPGAVYYPVRMGPVSSASYCPSGWLYTTSTMGGTCYIDKVTGTSISYVPNPFYGTPGVPGDRDATTIWVHAAADDGSGNVYWATASNPTLDYPPQNLGAVCSGTGQTIYMTFTWDPPNSGGAYTYFAPRMASVTGGNLACPSGWSSYTVSGSPACQANQYTKTYAAFAVSANQKYSFWVHNGDNSGINPAVFSNSSSIYNAYCTAPDLVGGQTYPTAATMGVPVQFGATITNQGAKDITTPPIYTFPNFFQVASAANGGGTITDLSPTYMSILGAGASADATSPSYTFATAGTYSVRVCANKSNSSTFGPETESDYTNNCGLWSNITVGTGAVNPTASISATPTVCTTSGETVSLTWSSSNATSCTVTSSSFGVLVSNGATSGTISATQTQSTTYSVSCSGASGTTPGTNSTTVTQCTPGATNPTITSFTYNQNSCTTSGESITLYWGASNATSCTLTNANSGQVLYTSSAASDSYTTTQLSSTSYTLTCMGGSGTTAATQTLPVTQCTPPSSTGSISGTDCTLPSGGGTCPIFLTWSSATGNKVDVTVTNANMTNHTYDPLLPSSGPSGTNYEWDVGPISSVAYGGPGTYVFTLYDASNNLLATSNTVHVYPPAPTAALAASSTSLTAGQSTRLTWSSTNATTCSGTNFSTGGLTQGQVTVTPTKNTPYTVTCTNGYTNARANVSVTVAASQPDLTAGSTSASGTPTAGTALTLSAPVSNLSTTTGTGSGFTDLFEINPGSIPSSFASIYALRTYSSAALGPSAGGFATASYTFPYAGTWYVRACADMDTNGSMPSSGATFTESDYTNNCGGGGSTSWTAITVGGTPSVTGFTSNVASNSCTSGSVTFSWTPMNAQYCNLTNTTSGKIYTVPAVNGSTNSTTTTQTTTSTYSLVCYDAAGDNTPQQTLTVAQCTAPAINSFSYTQNSCSLNSESITLNWSVTPAGTACTVRNMTKGVNLINGTTQTSYTTTQSATTQYRLICSGIATQPTITVSQCTPQPPSITSFTASPSRVLAGQTTTLTWSTQNAGSCTVTDPSGTVIGTGTSGTATPTVNGQTTYTLTCTNGTGTVSQGVTVYILPNYQEL